VEIEVVIEIPRGSFLKRGSNGHVDFISPLPCPFNYGSVPEFLGLDGDLLDALVLGPRLPLGTRIRVKAWGAVMLTDRGMTDDKLICCERSPNLREREDVLLFFRFYAKCKGLLNIWRRRPGAMLVMVGARPLKRLLAPDREMIRGRDHPLSSDSSLDMIASTLTP
jgi:inorganic pyrophosphatase